MVQKKMYTLHNSTNVWQDIHHPRITCSWRCYVSVGISLLAERDTATYNIQQLFTLVKDIASRHNFNFIPEKLVECASRNAATDTFQKEKEIPWRRKINNTEDIEYGDTASYLLKLGS